MKKWEDVKQELTVFTEEENKKMDAQADAVCTIIEKRDKLGINQNILSEILGIPEDIIKKIENFEIELKISDLHEIIKVLDDIEESRKSLKKC